MKKLNALGIVLFLLVAACKSDSAMENCTKDNYERGPLLLNWADNIILPTYNDYLSKLNALKAATDVFTENTQTSDLVTLRAAWLEAYKVWQYAAIFEIGEAEFISFRDYTNFLPADASLIENNIATGVYNLEITTNFHAQGFPALDYLINGLGASDAEIVSFYANETTGIKYLAYLSDVVNRLISLTNAVIADWNNGYRSRFIANDCSSDNSSLDKLTNDLIFNLEKVVRKAKIGDPIDYFGGGANKNPLLFEAYYKGDVSKELLLVSLNASKDFFNGKHYNSTNEGESLKSYLNEIQAEAGGRLLSIVIEEYYNRAIATSNSLSNNFAESLETDMSNFRKTREDIHRVVGVLKTNMLASIGVKADYNDSDGD